MRMTSGGLTRLLVCLNLALSLVSALKLSSNSSGQPDETPAKVTFSNPKESHVPTAIFSRRVWPPAPPKNAEDAKRVKCYLARRSGLHVGNDTLDDLKKDLVRKGEFTMTVRKDWAPKGAERFLNLVSLGFFDACPLHRAVKNFLVQFGVSSDPEMEKKWGRSTFPDDPLRPELLPLPAGTLAFAGGGKNSRTTQLWMSFNQGVAGKELWEAPVGYVHQTDGLSVVKSINTEYGDAKCFGGHAPDPHAGLALLRTDNPKLDYFESCSIIPSDQAAIAAHSSSLASVELTQVELIPPGEKRSLKTSTGHVFVAKRGGPEGETLGQVRVSELDQLIDLGGLKL